MEPISLILAALSAGATAGATATGSAAITDAYAALKRLVTARLGRSTALERFERDPEGGAADLRQELVAGRADTDTELIERATRLAQLTSAAGTTFNVNFHGGVQGAVTGNHNTVNMRFGPESTGS